jgi:hypothetical protein
MKVYTVEGQNWLKDVELDGSLYDQESAVYFEAMTQGLESFIQGDYEESGGGEASLGAYMIAYERGNTSDEHKSIALTEYVLYNAGHHVLGDAFREINIEEQKKKRKKS